MEAVGGGGVRERERVQQRKRQPDVRHAKKEGGVKERGGGGRKEWSEEMRGEREQTQKKHLETTFAQLTSDRQMIVG